MDFPIPLFAVILVPLHAYVAFYLAYPWRSRPEILGNVITGIILIVIDSMGYVLWAMVGFSLKRWLGALIFFILYLAWGTLWYFRGLRRYEEDLMGFGMLDRKAEKLAIKGFSLRKGGRIQEANKAFDKAIELTPDDSARWHTIAYIYALKGDKESVLKYLLKLTTLHEYKDYYIKTIRNDFKWFLDDEDFRKIIS